MDGLKNRVKNKSDLAQFCVGSFGAVYPPSGNYLVPEVTVYFDHRLLRGNRTVKVTHQLLLI